MTTDKPEIIIRFAGDRRDAQVVERLNGFSVQYEYSRKDGVWHNYVKRGGGTTFKNLAAAKAVALKLVRSSK